MDELEYYDNLIAENNLGSRHPQQDELEEFNTIGSMLGLKKVTKVVPDQATVLAEIIADMDENEGKPLIGKSTGFDNLDWLTEGYQKSQVWLIGGASSSGKSQFALQLISNLVDKEVNCVLFSLEMPRAFNYYRMAGNKHSVAINSLRKGKIPKAERDEYLKSVVSPYLKVYDLEARGYKAVLDAIRFEHTQGTNVFFIDYLQIMMGGLTSHGDVSKVIHEIQALTQELGITIIMLSQVTKAKTNERSQGSLETADFKGSGDLENASNVGIFIAQDLSATERADVVEAAREQNEQVVYPMTIKITKNRDGNGTGFIPVKSTPAFGRFEEMTRQEHSELVRECTSHGLTQSDLSDLDKI